MYNTSYIRMPIPMLRFQTGRFSGFCHFRMTKEFAVEMKTLYDSPYFLIYIRRFDVISNYTKINLT